MLEGRRSGSSVALQSTGVVDIPESTAILLWPYDQQRGSFKSGSREVKAYFTGRRRRPSESKVHPGACSGSLAQAVGGQGALNRPERFRGSVQT